MHDQAASLGLTRDRALTLRLPLAVFLWCVTAAEAARSVFLRHLPTWIKPSQIAEFLSQFGSLKTESIKIRGGKVSPWSPGVQVPVHHTSEERHHSAALLRLGHDCCFKARSK